MSHIGSRPITLDAAERARLCEALDRDCPRLAGDDLSSLTTLLVEQPFFPRYRILAAQVAPGRQAHVAVNPFGEVAVLTARLDTLQKVAALEQPAGLGEAERARSYANLGDYWTIENELGDLLIERFSEIPFWQPQSDAERASIERWSAELAAQVRPPELSRTTGGHLLVKWVVARKRLVRRELTVFTDGRLTRVDEVKAVGLPVHPGNLWGLDGHRMVPIG
jgi:hypothetical protein